ncbi:TlpA disulfide reductase family protein [uncultured Aquabacterium sp.]|uniref:TlpA disulfide reductase family protein n=1 Tax=uncultured Aquabacterium sp. TaxID=158753 RepID=UPI0030D120D4|tara:strand:+ start:877 stop:1431 length:555 start_codon:yes stop_codon:yes gene_type:complete
MTLTRRRLLQSAPALPAAIALGGLGGLVTAPAWLSGCADQASSQLPDLPFTQLDGSAHRTTEFKGRVAIVNFWATSCTTCVKEMPQMVATHRRFAAQGLEFLAVAMSYDPPAYVMQFAQTRQLPFRVAIDHDGGIAKGFGDVQLTPTTFVIDRQGRIAKRYVGEPDFEALHALLAKLLAAPAAA